MKVNDGGILGQLPEQEYIILKEDDFVNLKISKDKDDDIQIIVENYEHKELDFKGIGFLYISKDIVDKKERYILEKEIDGSFGLMLINDGYRSFIEQTKWEAEMDKKDPFWYMKLTIGEIEEKYGIKVDFDDLLKKAKIKTEAVKIDRKNRGPTIKDGRIVIGTVFDVLRKQDSLFDEKVYLSCEIAKLEEILKNK